MPAKNRDREKTSEMTRLPLIAFTSFLFDIPSPFVLGKITRS
jgi:hypothetical protein